MDDDDDAPMGDAVRKAWEGVQSVSPVSLPRLRPSPPLHVGPLRYGG